MYNNSASAYRGSLLAAVLLGLWPAISNGGWLGLRNDTPAVIVVQQSYIVNNKVVPGRPLVLYPGEVNWDSVVQPCVRTIAVYDPRQPQRPLYENKLTCGTHDLFFTVTSVGGQVQFERTSLLPGKKAGR